MKLQPVGNNIIVKALANETTSAAGIIIPDTAQKDRPEQGEVLAVGPGAVLENGQRRAMDVQVGQKLVFKSYAPSEIKVDGEEYLVIGADDVLAIIN